LQAQIKCPLFEIDQEKKSNDHELSHLHAFIL